MGSVRKRLFSMYGYFPFVFSLLFIGLQVADCGLVLNEFIQHFEPVFYNQSELLLQLTRRKRDIQNDDDELRLEFTALNRLFKIRLRRDPSVFAKDAVLEDSEGRPIPFDFGSLYRGRMDDDVHAEVSGIVRHDGSFEGSIDTKNEIYYFEPSSSYFPDTVGFPAVAYRDSDVLHPNKDSCASHGVYLKRVEEGLSFCESSSCPSAKSVNSGSVISGGSVLPELNLTPQYVVSNKSETRGKVVSRNKRSQEGSNPELGPVIDKELYSGWVKGSEGRRRRALVDARKKTCMLYLQADHLFYKKMGSEEACIEAMTRHVQRVNNIYQAIDFDGDGEPDDINFMIKRIKVHTDKALKDPNYRYPGNYGVEKFLELFSEEDYDAFCLAYMFTYRDFEGGTLGLAWTGDLKNAGGVCEKNGHYRGSLKSLNTGIITLLNYGKHVPPAVSHVTLAHEIGHNFGSPHDPENNKECTPGGEDGNYIMFARATSGDKRNNNKFSPCSLRSINGVLNAKARDSRGCFTELQTAICGNGVVEPGEECDCGWEEDCKETCCFPMSTNPRLNEQPCTLRSKKMCSPSQGPCCTEECQLRYGTKCRDDNGCRDASFCDGSSAECPASNNKPNKTVCNEEFVCFMGECTGSICLAYGLESCQCLPGPGDPPTKSCELCCKLPGDDQPCLSSFEWNKLPYDVPDMNAKPGTPCNNYNGYCDVFQRCREVDPSGPLATLRRLLLSDESLASLKVWIEDHWYAVLFIVLGFFVALVAVVKVFGKRPMIKRQSKSSGHRRRRPTEDVTRNPQVQVENGVMVHPTAVRTNILLGKKVRKDKRKKKSRSEPKKERDKQQVKIRDKVSMWLENETVPVSSLPKRGSLDSLCETKNVSTETTLSPGSSQDARIEKKCVGKLNRSQSETQTPLDRKAFTRSFSHVDNINESAKVSRSSRSAESLAKSQPDLAFTNEEVNPELLRMESQTALVDPDVPKLKIPKSKTEISLHKRVAGRTLRSASLQNLFAMIKHQTKRPSRTEKSKVIGLGRIKLVLKPKPSEKPKKKAKKKQVIVYSNNGYKGDVKTVPLAVHDSAYQHPVKAVENISKKKHSHRNSSGENDLAATKFRRQVSEPANVPEIKIRENPLDKVSSSSAVQIRDEL